MVVIKLATLTVFGRDHLTHSRLSSYRRCPREHYYRYELGIRRDRTAQPLRLGAAFHVGLDLMAQGVERDDAINTATVGYDEVPPWCSSEEQLTDWAVERETVRAMLAAYHWRWSESTIKIIASEQTFDMPIVNPDTGRSTPTFRLAGKIDKVIRLDDGRLAVMEHKTTGVSIEPTSDYWNRLTIDQQISAYMLGARSLGHDVQTVIYDVTRKPSIAPKKLAKADQGLYGIERETPAMFGQRLLEDMAGRTDFYFARVEICRLESDLRDFQVELWQMQRQIQQARNTGRWWRNAGACLMMGRCEYADVCFAGQSLGPDDEVPRGFLRGENLHPELNEEIEA